MALNRSRDTLLPDAGGKELGRGVVIDYLLRLCPGHRSHLWSHFVDKVEIRSSAKSRRGEDRKRALKRVIDSEKF